MTTHVAPAAISRAVFAAPPLWIAPTVKSDCHGLGETVHERVRRVHEHQREAD